MNLAEIQKAFPIGSWARPHGSDPSRQRARIAEHCLYNLPGDGLHGRYYIGVQWEGEGYGLNHYWPEEFQSSAPLTPFEQSLQEYIDEEMRLLNA